MFATDSNCYSNGYLAGCLISKIGCNFVVKQIFDLVIRELECLTMTMCFISHCGWVAK